MASLSGTVVLVTFTVICRGQPFVRENGWNVIEDAQNKASFGQSGEINSYNYDYIIIIIIIIIYLSCS
jgi:hypothetical protein